jgi:peptidoglycan/LPS O-acetylase OafA/YrhL
MTRSELERDLVIVACAISAGVHAALTPEHFREGAGAGWGFLAAGVLLACLVAALTRRPDDTRALRAAALTLGGLIAAYALAITSGLPLLHPEAEPVTGLALVTKAIEGAALLASLHLLRRPSTIPMTLRPKGTLT